MAGQNPLISGLYAITEARLMPEPVFLARAEAALRGGARILQYRDKGEVVADATRRRRQAGALRELCAQYNALFVVNDDPLLAQAVAAPALHVVAEDVPLAALRAQFGRAILVGVSCYGSVRQAQEAAALGADYVAFGSFFASPSKPQAPVVSVDVLTAARAVIDLPIVAIGGITEANGGALIAAGADALAVISGVFGAENVEGAARRFTALFSNRKE